MLKEEERRDEKRAQSGYVTANPTNSTSVPATTDAAAINASSSVAAKPARSISYAAERVIGTGSFGVVYQAMAIETRDTVAIKKVLQDQRYKNRELQIMSVMSHPCVVGLKHCFYSSGEVPNELYLNLVMEYIPDTIYKSLRHHTKARKYIHSLFVCVFMYQIFRSVAYIHSLGICHRDIKPQNLLLNARTHVVKLCDFGSAKKLVKNEPNVSYICSRYYRAPELVCESRDYTTAVDIWSVGCVFAELLLGAPIFPGDSSNDQLTEIIKVLGVPSKEDIEFMKPEIKINAATQLTHVGWDRIFRERSNPDIVDLMLQLLCYNPTKRIDAFDALAHPYFNDLRKQNFTLPDGTSPPHVFNFTEKELQTMKERNLTSKLIPDHIAKNMTEEQLKLCNHPYLSSPTNTAVTATPVTTTTSATSTPANTSTTTAPAQTSSTTNNNSNSTSVNN